MTEASAMETNIAIPPHKVSRRPEIQQKVEERERMFEMSGILFEKAPTIKYVDPQDKMNQVTFSFGIAQYILGESAKEFLDRANLAMHEAKETGRDKACIAGYKDGKIEFEDLKFEQKQ